jgi:hypothetical protein
MRTAQQLFDLISTHLLTQKSKSTDGKACFYRDQDGKKCALGIVISDAEYSPTMERQTLSMLLQNNGDGYQLSHDTAVEMRLNFDLLRALQVIHDVNYPDMWAHSLQRIAEEFRLEFQLPNEKEET